MEKRPHGEVVAIPTLPFVTLVSMERMATFVVEAMMLNAVMELFLRRGVA